MAILIENISKKYDEKNVLVDINIDINRGQVLGIVGNNGAGKTTLMKILCGNIVKFKGNIIYPKFNSKRKIGYLIENPKFYTNETGFENLIYFSRLFSIDDNIDVSINKIIQILNMEEYIHLKVKKYSLGMKQKLGIAIALLGEPDFLILDEPTNGMDPKGITSILKYLKYLAHEKQIGILISSHQLDNIQEISDIILIIEKGKIIKNINRSEFTCSKLIQLKVNKKDLNKTKIILEEKGLNVNIENNILIFKSKDLNSFIQSLYDQNIIVENIHVSEFTLKDLYFERKVEIKNEYI